MMGCAAPTDYISSALLVPSCSRSGLLHFGIFALAVNFFFDVHKVLLEFYITILRPAFQAPLAHKGTALWDGV